MLLTVGKLPQSNNWPKTFQYKKVIQNFHKRNKKHNFKFRKKPPFEGVCDDDLGDHKYKGTNKVVNISEQKKKAHLINKTQ